MWHHLFNHYCLVSYIYQTTVNLAKVVVGCFANIFKDKTIVYIFIATQTRILWRENIHKVFIDSGKDTLMFYVQ